MKKQRIVIADDHALYLEGLRSLISRVEALEIVGEATNGKELLALAQQHQPEIVLLDHDMPEMSGLEVATNLRQQGSEQKIIVITASAVEAVLFEFVQLGVDGIIPKTSSADTMFQAICAVAEGERYMPDEISAKVSRADALSKLTSRERQVLRLIAEGNNNKLIAQIMGVALKTVDTHRANLMRKLDLHSTAEAIRFALTSGLL